MICLDNTDLLQGDADNATEVDYTIHGLVGSTFTQLAAGQLANAKGTLYTAGAAVSVVCITFVNTGAAAQAVNLYLDPAAGGNSRRMIPEDMSLGIGHSMHFDGQRLTVCDATGGILYTAAVHSPSHLAGGSDPLLAAPGAIGGGTPAAGAFTTLDASGLISADGGQIAFPASQNASADVNTLDDYEEGTWTPAITFGGGATGLTYTTQLGNYVKIGKMVSVSGYIALSNKGSSSGVALITSLPFAVGGGSGNFSASAMRINVITFANIFQCFATTSGTTVSLEEITEGGVVSALRDTDFANNSEIMLDLKYFI